jgi:hypothetical protein
VGAGLHVRVDPQPEAGPAADLGRGHLQGGQLIGRLDVDDDAAAGGEAEFFAGLADSGEHDPAGAAAGPQDPQQFPAADHVEAGAEGGQPPQQGKVAVRLDRVEDLAGTEGGLQAPVGGRDRVQVVQVEGGAGRPGEVVDGQATDGQATDMEHTVAVGERLAAVEVEGGCRGHAASSGPVRRAGRW